MSDPLSEKRGTHLPNVTMVVAQRAEFEDVHRTPGGVYVWGDGTFVTLYTSGDGDTNRGLMVPIERVAYMQFGGRE